MNTERRRAPLVIFGLDAGDPRFIEQWARQGELPAIASIMERGGWARTCGAELVAEHGAWVAISTGISRAQHGFYSYRQSVPGAYEIHPVLGHEASPPPFWTRLPEGYRVAVVDIPDAPVAGGVDGIQIQDWATHYAYGEPPRGAPESTLREVQRRFGHRPYVPEKPVSTAAEDRALYREMMDRIRLKGEMGRWLLGQGSYDLVFFVFADTHTGGHQFWGANTQGPEDLRQSLKSIYQAIDREIEKMLQMFDESPNVLLISSLGLKAQYPTEDLTTEFLRLIGLQPSPHDSGVPTRDPLGWLRKLVGPGIRRQINRVLPRGVQENLISQKFRTSTDWARTRMYCVPAYYAGFLRVNLKGREPEGIVEPGAEYEEVLNYAEAELMKLIDPKTNRPAIGGVFRTIDLFGFESTRVLPDLFVEFSEADHFLDRLVHPRGEIRQQPGEFHRSSDHSREGFVAAAGPDILASGEMAPVEILDLAPTFLKCLGAGAHKELPGTVLADWVTDSDATDDRPEQSGRWKRSAG